jgi:hypothetical protein
MEELTIERECNAAVMAALQVRTESEIAARFAGGHRAYIAKWKGESAAFGWVATRYAEIGELRSRMEIPTGERYLWNFVTLKAHRGMGIYPRLLDGIVRRESSEAQRFWVAYAPENHASGSGIHKAGFVSIAELGFDTAGGPAVNALVDGGGAVAAQVLGLPETMTPLAPCWRCVRAGRGNMTCAPGSCACDYQLPEKKCAA